MNTEVRAEDLEINNVEDLYLTVMIPNGEDAYDGGTIYNAVTVWYYINDIDFFVSCMEMLGVDAFMEFRDEMDANILSSLAQSRKPIEFWNVVENFVGHDNFIDLLTMRDRSGQYPITEIKDVEVFAEQLNKILITRDMMRQIAIHGTDEVVEYVTNIINLFNPNDMM